MLRSFSKSDIDLGSGSLSTNDIFSLMSLSEEEYDKDLVFRFCFLKMSVVFQGIVASKPDFMFFSPIASTLFND